MQLSIPSGVAAGFHGNTAGYEKASSLNSPFPKSAVSYYHDILSLSNRFCHDDPLPITNDSLKKQKPDGSVMPTAKRSHRQKPSLFLGLI